MKSPLTPSEAKKKLYNIVGSDSLYDHIDDVFRKENQNDDVRWAVASWIKDNWLSTSGQKSFFQKWDDGAYEIVKKVVNKYKK